jgi:glycosyltransferase involved in cell wall biosynthesis
MGVDRVIFVAVSEILGGGELYLLRTASAAARFTEVAVAGALGTPVAEEAGRLGLPTIELPLGRKLGRATAVSNMLRYPVARGRLRSFVDRAEGDWTLLQYKWEELLWAGAVAHDRVALWEHGPIPEPLLRLRWSRRRLRRAFSTAAHVFAWSTPARAAIIRLCGRSPVMLAAGVDAGRASEAIGRREAVRARLGLADQELLLVYVGRLAEDKGPAAAVAALTELPEARLVICGDGPMRKELPALADRLGVSDRVELTGFVENPLPYLAAGDVTMLLTRSPGEGRPLTAVESSALGTPVLGLTGEPAMEELADEGRARLVESEEPGAVARAAAELARRPRRPVQTPSWDETAATFLRTLGGGPLA